MTLFHGSVELNKDFSNSKDAAKFLLLTPTMVEAKKLKHIRFKKSRSARFSGS